MVDKRTEQFAEEAEAIEQIWQKKYGKNIPEIVKKMNLLLKERTKESRIKLHDLFLDKQFFENYKHTDIVAEMYIIMKIYEKELKDGIENGILEQGNTVEELRRYLQELKFILYRVDFDIDKESEDELLFFLKQHNTSMATLEIMSTTVVMRPIHMMLKLENIFKRKDMYREKFVIDNFINQRWPGNYRILYEQAEICKKVGREEYARECLLKIPVYSQEVWNETKRVYDIQEKMWRLKYKDETVCSELVSCIKEEKISSETWKCFLQNEPSFEADYYLLLANELYNEGVKDITWETLAYGEKISTGNEMILCFMAELCIDKGKWDEAIECLRKVKNPGEMTYRFLEVCEKKR